MCNCFEDTLARISDHIKPQIPANATDFKIDWQGRAFMLSAGEYAPTNPKLEYSYQPMKKDGTPAKNRRKDTVSIIASHCCFCGEKFDRPEKKEFADA